MNKRQKIILAVSSAVVVVVVVLVVFFVVRKKNDKLVSVSDTNESDDTAANTALDTGAVYTIEEQQYIPNENRLIMDKNLCKDYCGGLSASPVCRGFDTEEDAVECGKQQCDTNPECKAFTVMQNNSGYLSLSMFNTQESSDYNPDSGKSTLYLKNTN